MKDPSLRACSLAARGLWIDLLCLMHESPQRGYLLLTKTEPMHDEHIARCVGADQSLISNLIEELSKAGVLEFGDLDGRNMICSRRMIRDESKREKCSAAGMRGGNPALKRTGKGGDGSSSSSSFSSSTSSAEIKRYKEMDGVDEVWKSIPRAKQKQPSTTKVKIGMALEKIADSDEVDGRDPIGFLMARIQCYYNSAEGRGEYWRNPSRWLDEDGYMEPDEAWTNRSERAAL